MSRVQNAFSKSQIKLINELTSVMNICYLIDLFQLSQSFNIDSVEKMHQDVTNFKKK